MEVENCNNKLNMFEEHYPEAGSSGLSIGSLFTNRIIYYL